MAYIGRAPITGQFEKQLLSADSSTTSFALNWSVGSESALIVSVGGVLQEPGVAYNLSAGTKETHCKDTVPDNITVPSTDEEKTETKYYERTTYIKNKGDHKIGDKYMRKKVNDSYDPSLSYKPRSERRKEWCVVGLLGQVEVRDTAIIPTSWTEMKNLESGIDLYYIK